MITDPEQAGLEFEAFVDRFSSPKPVLNRKPPTLADFGLTEADAAEVRARNDRRSTIGFRLMIGVFGTSGLYLAHRWVEPQSLGSWLGTLALAYMLGGMMLPFVGIVVVAFVERVVYRIDPNAKQLDRFENAKKDYAQWKKRTEHEYWMALRPIAFEKEIATLYRTLGYGASLTPPSGDKGVDIFLTRGEEVIIVQCKTNAKPWKSTKSLALYQHTDPAAILAAVVKGQ